MCFLIGCVFLKPVFANADFPEKPVRIVVPFLAGGSADALIRIVSDELGSRLGQPVVVENKAGAGGILGADYVSRAKPDGYTLLFTPPGPLTTNDFLIKELPYNAREAFEAITLVTVLPNVLLTNVERAGVTLESLVKEGKANPEKFTFGSQGVGTTGHLTGVLFNKMTGANLRHIPYKGFPPALVDVIGGRVDFMFVDTGNALPQIRSDKLTAVAIASEHRVPSLPKVPTFRELGYSELVSYTWFALMAPTGTPADVRLLIRDKLAEVLALNKIKEQLQLLGAQPIGNSPEELDRFINEEYERWGALIKEIGLSVK